MVNLLRPRRMCKDRKPIGSSVTETEGGALKVRRPGKGFRSRRELATKDKIATLILVSVVAIIGAIFGALFGEAIDKQPKLILFVFPLAAIFYSSAKEEGLAVRAMNTLLSLKEPPMDLSCGDLLFLLIGGVIFVGNSIAIGVIGISSLDLDWLTKAFYEAPWRFIVGMLIGVALFAFRKIMFTKKSWSDWTTIDIFYFVPTSRKVRVQRMRGHLRLRRR